MALPTNLPTLDFAFLGLPFLNEAVFNDFVDSQTLNIAAMGLPFVSNAAAYETTKQGLGVLTASATTGGIGHRIGRPSGALTASATTASAGTLRGIPTKPNNLDFHFLGFPFADQPGDTYVNILTLNYARVGLPFASNAAAVYRTTKTANSAITASAITQGNDTKRTRAAASITASATTSGTATVRQIPQKPNSLDFHFLGFPFADQPGDTYVNILALNYARVGLPFASNATAYYRTTKTANGILTATAVTVGNDRKITRAAASITGSATTSPTATVRQAPKNSQALDFHFLGTPFVWKPSGSQNLLRLDYSLLGLAFASGWVQVISSTASLSATATTSGFARVRKHGTVSLSATATTSAAAAIEKYIAANLTARATTSANARAVKRMLANLSATATTSGVAYLVASPRLEGELLILGMSDGSVTTFNILTGEIIIRQSINGELTQRGSFNGTITLPPIYAGEVVTN